MRKTEKCVNDDAVVAEVVLDVEVVRGRQKLATGGTPERDVAVNTFGEETAARQTEHVVHRVVVMYALAEVAVCGVEHFAPVQTVAAVCTGMADGGGDNGQKQQKNLIASHNVISLIVLTKLHVLTHIFPHQDTSLELNICCLYSR